LTIDYQRQTDALSISSLPVQAASTAWTGYPRACLNDRHFALGAGGNRIVVDRCRYSRFVTWQRGSQMTKAIKRQNQDNKKKAKTNLFIVLNAGSVRSLAMYSAAPVALV